MRLVLDYLNQSPNPGLAQRVVQDYGQGLALDQGAVNFIAYGLRPEIRDIKKEQSGLRRFGRIFGKMPDSVFAWNVFRKLVY